MSGTAYPNTLRGCLPIPYRIPPLRDCAVSTNWCSCYSDHWSHFCHLVYCDNIYCYFVDSLTTVKLPDILRLSQRGGRPGRLYNWQLRDVALACYRSMLDVWQPHNNQQHNTAHVSDFKHTQLALVLSGVQRHPRRRKMRHKSPWGWIRTLRGETRQVCYHSATQSPQFGVSVPEKLPKIVATMQDF